MSTRRQFITLLGGAATLPIAASAQQGERVRRIGFLRAAPPPERDLGAFLRGLASRGWVQGRNFVLRLPVVTLILTASLRR
jgi:hypothetical protein